MTLKATALAAILAASVAGAGGAYYAVRTTAARVAPPAEAGPAAEAPASAVPAPEQPSRDADQPVESAAPVERQPEAAPRAAPQPRRSLPSSSPRTERASAGGARTTAAPVAVPEPPARTLPSVGIVAKAAPDEAGAGMVAPPTGLPSGSAAAVLQSIPPVTPAVDLPPPAPIEPVRPRFVELTVVEGSVIGIRLETSLTSETARLEDRVTAVVTRDVTVDGLTAVPAGARLEGYVSTIDRGGRFSERARLGVRFTTLVLGENTRLRLDTDTVYRDGESPTGEATSKIGASAVVGSILGAVIGGRKGAAIGGAAGAAGGTAAVAAGGRNAATLLAGASLTVRLASDLVVQVERQDDGSR